MAGRINRTGLSGAAASVATHLVFGLVAIWSVRTLGPPPEPHAVRVELVPLSALLPPAPARASRIRAARPASPRPAAFPRASIPAAPATAPGVPTPAPAPASDEAARLAAIHATLRAAVGCSYERLLHLTAAERAHCSETFAHGPDPSPPWGVPIPADKLAIFEQEAQARKGARRPDLLGCVLPFDAKGFKPVSGPGYGTKLGPLPCYTGRGRALKSQDIQNGLPRAEWAR